MKDLIAKLEALLSTNEYKFYKDGVQDCIKVVKDYLTSHKTRQSIQVTEGEFKADEYGNLKASKGGVQISMWHVKADRQAYQIWIRNDPTTTAYYGELLKDGVIAVNEELKKMYEDVSEVVE